MYIRNGVAFDSYSETGAEGFDDEDLPPDLGTPQPISSAEAEAAVIEHVAISSGGSDFVRWPRHFCGPTQANQIVKARMRLADQGVIVFRDHYWRLALLA